MNILTKYLIMNNKTTNTSTQNGAVKMEYHPIEHREQLPTGSKKPAPPPPSSKR